MNYISKLIFLVFLLRDDLSAKPGSFGPVQRFWVIGFILSGSIHAKECLVLVRGSIGEVFGGSNI